MADDRLIVALDFATAQEARIFTTKLGESVSFYKIGLGMLAGGGLDLAAKLKEEGKRVFLDMKLFDIGATVEAAVRNLSQLGVDFLTVHGDPHVVRAAAKGRGSGATRILAVTFLTSLDRPDLDSSLIIDGEVSDLVRRRAEIAFDAGADGAIASPREAKAIRRLQNAAGKKIVTPGIRPQGHPANDQKRIATPIEAIQSGADHIVVGRPIWQAANPQEMVESIIRQMPA